MNGMKNKKLAMAGLGALFVLILALVFALGSTSLPADAAESQPKSQDMPVQAKVIEPVTIQLWKNFSGHMIAVDRAEIRPQVSGLITDIKFEDGQIVQKNDVLMVIDPRPYKAALDQAVALLEAAKTQQTLAEKEYTRAKSLIDSDAISQKLLDERSNALASARASIKAAQAQVQRAEIDLDYAYVKAPIGGRISRAEITEGNLVEAGSSAPLLTSIVADSSIYVDFEIDERTYINMIRNVDVHSYGDVPVRVGLSDGSNRFYEGAIHSFDNKIDPLTGTIRARAIFENPKGLFLSGMSVGVQLGSANPGQKIMLSERAIGTDQDRKFVYIVDAEGKTAYQPVTLGESVDGKREILSGLKSGDIVVVEGIVRIRPGMPVSPVFGDQVTEKTSAEAS